MDEGGAAGPSRPPGGADVPSCRRLDTLAGNAADGREPVGHRGRAHHRAQTRAGRRTRERIIETAAELMFHRGAKGTSIPDIQAAAEVSASQIGGATGQRTDRTPWW
ncbi:TetR family transcriptional regulator [Streptomyces sp. AC627_RSS907]|uniref:TetR family transcriptional regulator n=1 Tax=Streptomyces sp. AC627_RSS907 TaxID=2823684 RepID=UPI0020B7A254|nr:TetR family transcriptional regulator [Streptomyces sp. AC627_RSS907]